MAKEKKEKGKKGRKGLKALIIIFSLLCVAAAGVVLGLTYWPSNGEKIANVLIEFNQKFEDENSLKADNNQVKAFINKNVDNFTEGYESYKNEAQGYENVVDSLLIVTNFYGENFESIINDGLRRKDEKELRDSLSDFETDIQKMSDYLDEHEKELTTTALTAVGWEVMRDYYKDLISDACEITSKLENLSNKKIHGIYGNQLCVLSIKAVRSYYEVIRDSYFEDGFTNAGNGYTQSDKLKTFVEEYFKSKVKLLDYSFNSELQEKVKNIGLLEEKTSNKVNFYYLILNNFPTDGNFSDEQNGYISIANNFLKSEGGVI